MSERSEETQRVARFQAKGKAAPDERLPAGTQVGEYLVTAFLGAGAHGNVYAAQHRVLGRRVAIKVLRHEVAASRELSARFVREAQVVNQARHPGIVDIHDLGVLADGRPYCVMELLEGRTLTQVLRARAPLPQSEAVEILAPLCAALEAAHQLGVVHRDVKPGNVVVLESGAGQRIKLLDFGVAKLLQPGTAGLTVVGEKIGTPSSMSPEQIRGEPVDGRADVYALGVLLHLMLTGRRPFESSDPAELERMHLTATPPRPSSLAPVPVAFDALVARCLEKEREKRWPSAAALREAALAALEERPEARLHEATGLAVYVAPLAGDAADFAALAARAELLEEAEARLRRAGFNLLLASAGSLLAVRLLPDDPAQARAARAADLSLAGALSTELGRQGTPLLVAVHCDRARVGEGPAGPVLAGGPLCDLASWLPQGAAGLVATAEARAGLGADSL